MNRLPEDSSTPLILPRDKSKSECGSRHSSRSRSGRQCARLRRRARLLGRLPAIPRVKDDDLRFGNTVLPTQISELIAQLHQQRTFLGVDRGFILQEIQDLDLERVNRRTGRNDQHIAARRRFHQLEPGNPAQARGRADDKDGSSRRNLDQLNALRTGLVAAYDGLRHLDDGLCAVTVNGVQLPQDAVRQCDSDRPPWFIKLRRPASATVLTLYSFRFHSVSRPTIHRVHIPTLKYTRIPLRAPNYAV